MPEQDKTAGPLGILAGGGRLPVSLAEAARAAGRDVFIVGLYGFAEPAIEAFPHLYARAGEIGRVMSGFKGASCRDVVMVGHFSRPRWSEIRIDFGVWRAFRLWRFGARGDDGAMRLVTECFEQAGFHVVSPGDVAPELIAPLGSFGKMAPTRDEAEAIDYGFSVLNALGPFDIGQGLVLHRRRILAVEGAEGTDLMIERIGMLRATERFKPHGRAGILVKGPKPQQELRNDMPVIGAATIERAIAAGLAGIAVTAGRVLVSDGAELAAKADAAGLFVVGVAPAAQPAS